MFMAAGVSGQVTIAFDQADPPFMYQKGDSPAGLYPSLFKEAFSRMGISATLVAVPWKRALDGADSGANGVGGIYQNTERLAKYDFSAPYYEERVAVYGPRNKGASFTTMEDLYGKTVGVISGWSYGDEFDNAVKTGKIKTDAGDGDNTNFAKLSAGRVDFVLAIVESGDAAVKTQGLADSLSRFQKLLTVNKVYLVFNKSTNQKDLLAAFDKTMLAMKTDGSFQKIVNEAFQ